MVIVAPVIVITHFRSEHGLLLTTSPCMRKDILIGSIERLDTYLYALFVRI